MNTNFHPRCEGKSFLRKYYLRNTTFPQAVHVQNLDTADTCHGKKLMGKSLTEATPETQQKPYSRADKLASACLWFLIAAMPGQNVLQVSVCCWSTRGQPNNDELLWVTQKRPILKMLLPNLLDSPCWDCCSVCAGPPFYWYRLIPTDL